MKALDRIPPHWISALSPDLIDRGRAWTLVAAGEASAARSVLLRSADDARNRGLAVAEMRLLHDVARLGEPARVAPRLAELTRVVAGEMVQLCAAHAAASARGNLTELEAAARGFESIGALLLAAEAAQEAELASQRAALRRQAAFWQRRVRALRSELGEVRTPLLAGTSNASFLTQREREVAQLASAGASSKEIAERLYLSVRTVNNHLQHVYDKLGVSGRRDLSAALDRVEG